MQQQQQNDEHDLQNQLRELVLKLYVVTVWQYQSPALKATGSPLAVFVSNDHRFGVEESGCQQTHIPHLSLAIT